MNVEPLEGVADTKKASETITKQLSAVYELILARRQYLKRMIALFSAPEVSLEVQQIHALYCMYTQQDVASIPLDIYKKETKACFEGYVKSYENILNQILWNEHDQALLDGIHFHLIHLKRCEYNERELAKEAYWSISKGKSPELYNLIAKTPAQGKKKTKKIPNNFLSFTGEFWETPLINSCLALIEDLISLADKKFYECYEIEYKAMADGTRHPTLVSKSRDGQKKLETSLLDCHLKITSLIKDNMGVNHPGWSEAVVHWGNVLEKEILHFDISSRVPETIADVRKKFIALFKMLQKAKEFKQKLENILAAVKKSANTDAVSKKETVVRNKKQMASIQEAAVRSLQTNMSVSADTPVSQKLSSLHEVSLASAEEVYLPLQQESGDALIVIGAAPVALDPEQAYRDLRTEEWKATVASRRQEKTRLRSNEIKEQNEVLQRNPAASEIELVRLAKVRLHIAFLLLKPLKATNLELLQEIHARPTPHLRISYDRIQNLFNGTEESLGLIQENTGSSHRKITIKGTLGFFNQLSGNTASLDESKDTKKNEIFKEKTVGPAFKPHRKNSLGKTESMMPRTAIEMIRDTLDRADVSRHHLNLFLDVKRKMVSLPKANLSLEDMLQMAEDCQKSQKRLTFCYGIQHPTGACVLGQLQVNPDPEARFGEREQQVLLKLIFSYN